MYVCMYVWRSTLLNRLGFVRPTSQKDYRAITVPARSYHVQDLKEKTIKGWVAINIGQRNNLSSIYGSEFNFVCTIIVLYVWYYLIN